MGRPKRVSFKTFAEYNKLHTKKTKMMSGVEQTTLYPVKETKEFYQSIEVWAYCASKFRMKKKNVELKIDIPIITDEKTVQFLNEKCWKDYVKKSFVEERTDMIEAVAYLDKVFPKHEKVYFYELGGLIGLYVQGTLVSFDDNGKVEERSEHNKEQIEYYKSKYTGWKKIFSPELENVFMEIGKNSVCYPVAFSKGTAEWAIEKYGKPMAYSNAGEIFFVVTNDKVFFEVKRHF